MEGILTMCLKELKMDEDSELTGSSRWQTYRFLEKIREEWKE